MICQTIRKGSDCAFMTAKGCGYNGGVCYEIVEACQGCGRAVQIETGWYCSSCPEPKVKWIGGSCNLATHSTSSANTNKAKLNPMKASKRKGR